MSGRRRDHSDEHRRNLEQQRIDRRAEILTLLVDDMASSFSAWCAPYTELIHRIAMIVLVLLVITVFSS